jgi:hypothetical protein
MINPTAIVSRSAAGLVLLMADKLHAMMESPSSALAAVTSVGGSEQVVVRLKFCIMGGSIA